MVSCHCLLWMQGGGDVEISGSPTEKAILSWGVKVPSICDILGGSCSFYASFFWLGIYSLEWTSMLKDQSLQLYMHSHSTQRKNGEVLRLRQWVTDQILSYFYFFVISCSFLCFLFCYLYYCHYYIQYPKIAVNILKAWSLSLFLPILTYCSFFF